MVCSQRVHESLDTKTFSIYIILQFLNVPSISSWNLRNNINICKCYTNTTRSRFVKFMWKMISTIIDWRRRRKTNVLQLFSWRPLLRYTYVYMYRRDGMNWSRIECVVFQEKITETTEHKNEYKFHRTLTQMRDRLIDDVIRRKDIVLINILTFHTYIHTCTMYTYIHIHVYIHTYMYISFSIKWLSNYDILTPVSFIFVETLKCKGDMKFHWKISFDKLRK